MGARICLAGVVDGSDCDAVHRVRNVQPGATRYTGWDDLSGSDGCWWLSHPGFADVAGIHNGVSGAVAELSEWRMLIV